MSVPENLYLFVGVPIVIPIYWVLWNASSKFRSLAPSLLFLSLLFELLIDAIQIGIIEKKNWAANKYVAALPLDCVIRIEFTHIHKWI